MWRRHVMIHYMTIRWLGSRVVSVLDSGAEGPGFKSQPRRCRVTVLGKLFTPIVPLLPSSEIGSSPLKGCDGNCKPDPERNGSLPPGLWLMSPAGWLPRTGISSGTIRSAIKYGPYIWHNRPRCVTFLTAAQRYKSSCMSNAWTRWRNELFRRRLAFWSETSAGKKTAADGTMQRSRIGGECALWRWTDRFVSISIRFDTLPPRKIELFVAFHQRTATSFAAWWTGAQWVWTVCLRLLPVSVATAIWTRAVLRLSPAR